MCPPVLGTRLHVNTPMIGKQKKTYVHREKSDRKRLTYLPRYRRLRASWAAA